jgi:hypothetical protein
VRRGAVAEQTPLNSFGRTTQCMSERPAEQASRWRVKRRGRAGITYEEEYDRGWRAMDIDGEMLSGTPSFVIYFGSIAAWREAPSWAQGRRDEIIARVKTAMPIPTYEYAGEGVMTECDWVALEAAAGGLSSERCAWQGCERLALNATQVCVRHAHPDLS